MGEKITETLKLIGITKVEMDEMWIIITKKLRQELKLKMAEHGCG